MKTTLNYGFTNREEYIAWRAKWRAQYAQLSQDIREHKLQRKDRDPATRSSAQYYCWTCRKEATALLELRKKSKEEAQRQYLAAKAASGATA